jgi:hypothetical protein
MICRPPRWRRRRALPAVSAFSLLPVWVSAPRATASCEDRIAFVLGRSGESRIWSFDVTGPLPRDEPSSGVEVSGEIVGCGPYQQLAIRLADGTKYELTNAKSHGVDTIGIVVRCVTRPRPDQFVEIGGCMEARARVERVIERLPGIPAGALSGAHRWTRDESPIVVGDLFVPEGSTRCPSRFSLAGSLRGRW